MKSLFCFILSGMVALSAFAGTVRITLMGNKNFVVMVDGRTYTPNSVSNGRHEILITDLLDGQHDIEIVRPNNRGGNRQIYSSSFYLGTNETLNITVNANGRVRMEETTENPAYGSNDNTGYRTAMTESRFSQLYNDISRRWGQASKMQAARDAFYNTGNYFSTYQVRQIILLLNSEANRLELAKLAFDNVVDPSSYTQIYDVLRSQASRNELDNYVRNNSPDYNDPYGRNPNSYRTPMSASSFNTLYQDIRKKWWPGGKMSAAKDAFNNSSNYFTTSQARQIIALVSNEDNRLELAKLSYDNIVDPANFRQVYDLLDSQASRDELDDYIRTNYNYPY